MIKVRVTLSFCFLFLFISCVQKENFNDIQSVKIFDIGNQQIKTFNSKDIKEFSEILKAKNKIKHQTYIWKGYRIIEVLTKNNNVIKIKASRYGNFIYIPSNKNYYTIPKEHINKWQTLVFN